MGKERKGLIRAVVDTNVFISATLYEGLISGKLSTRMDGKFHQNIYPGKWIFLVLLFLCDIFNLK